MPFYTYTALNTAKDLVKGQIEAASLKEAREYIRRLDLIPTKVEENDASAKKIQTQKTVSRNVRSASKNAKTVNLIKKKKKAGKLRGLNIREKLDFINSLYVLLKTGISLVEALLFIEMNITSKKCQRLAAEIRRMILSGSTLSEAIQKHPETFTPVYAGLILTGEQSGELELTLERMIYLLTKQDKLRGKIIATMIYPCFVISLAIVISLIMITFVFPKFKGMYDQMGQKLPLITQVFMDTGQFIIHYWYFVPVFIIGFIVAIVFIFTWPTTRSVIDKIALDIPVIRTFVQYAGLSNFISVLRVSFDAGIPIVDGIILANLTINNYKLKDALRDTASKIQVGQSLSSALKSSGVIPGMVMCMVATGEEAGQLSDTLKQAEIYIDTQLERIIEVLNKLMEPALLLVIGAVAMTLALALYLPLFKTYSNML